MAQIVFLTRVAQPPPLWLGQYILNSVIPSAQASQEAPPSVFFISDFLKEIADQEIFDICSFSYMNLTSLIWQGIINCRGNGPSQICSANINVSTNNWKYLPTSMHRSREISPSLPEQIPPQMPPKLYNYKLNFEILMKIDEIDKLIIPSKIENWEQYVIVWGNILLRVFLVSCGLYYAL